MRTHAFRRSLGFAALAALAWPACALALHAGLGLDGRGALSLYLVALTGLYPCALAPQRARGLAAGLVGVALAAVFVAVGRTPGAVALGAATALGVARSGLLVRRRAARALATEVAFLGGGLLLAACVAAPGLLGTALALWAFFLVQGVFPLVGGTPPRGASTAAVDAFERARARALALLEEAA
jgi:hypothetical protein